MCQLGNLNKSRKYLPPFNQIICEIDERSKEKKLLVTPIKISFPIKSGRKKVRIKKQEKGETREERERGEQAERRQNYLCYQPKKEKIYSSGRFISNIRICHEINKYWDVIVVYDTSTFSKFYSFNLHSFIRFHLCLCFSVNLTMASINLFLFFLFYSRLHQSIHQKFAFESPSKNTHR